MKRISPRTANARSISISNEEAGRRAEPFYPKGDGLRKRIRRRSPEPSNEVKLMQLILERLADRDELSYRRTRAIKKDRTFRRARRKLKHKFRTV